MPRCGASQAMRDAARKPWEVAVPVARAKAMSVRSYMASVGAISSTANLLTRSGWSRGQAVADPPPAVVADHGEVVEAERGHDFGLVPGHGALGIGLVMVAAGRLGAVAVTAQVGQHHGESLRQGGRDPVPHDLGLGVIPRSADNDP